MSIRSKPDSYQPPYPAFQAHQPADRPNIVMAMLGVQAAPGVNGAPQLLQLLALCAADLDGKPLHVEQGWHIDAAGYRNDVLMPYWAMAADMKAFFARADVTALLDTPLIGDIGLWRESLAAPTTALDGNYARPDVRYGIARYSEMKEEQYHAYMGSMRDRVPDYLAGKADGGQEQIARQDPPNSFGIVLEVTGLPRNLCFIRGAFAWNEAGTDEQQVFMEKMWPVYKEGAEYLRDNPIESNCISMRMIEEAPLGYDNGVQSEVLGWFLTLADLERWTRYHPRHLAIMKTIMSYMQQFNFKPKLNLGHEVIVVPEGGAVMRYNNCHPETGFLPFFPSRQCVRVPA